MYNIDYSLQLSHNLGSLYNEYRIFYVVIKALGNTPQIRYELKLQVSLVNKLLKELLKLY